MLLGSIISAGSVIVFFELGVGTQNSIFAKLHDEQDANSQSQAPKLPRIGQRKSHTPRRRTSFWTGGRGRGIGSRTQPGYVQTPCNSGGHVWSRSADRARLLLAAQNNRDRILFFVIFASGLAALLLTFSRAGLIAFRGWHPRSFRRRRLVRLGLPPGAYVRRCRFDWSCNPQHTVPLLLLRSAARVLPNALLLVRGCSAGYSQHPFLGVGLNNATAAMKAGRDELIAVGIPMPPTKSADSFYLALLTEVGPIGFILFLAFFGNVTLIALRATRHVATELTPLLVGMVAGLASLSTQNLADDTFAGHSIGAMLWLFAALIIAIARRNPTFAGGRVERSRVGAP